jgi:hypothetical protein
MTALPALTIERTDLALPAADIEHRIKKSAVPIAWRSSRPCEAPHPG